MHKGNRISRHARQRYDERRKPDYPEKVETALRNGEYFGRVTGLTKAIRYRELIFIINIQSHTVETVLPYEAFRRKRREQKLI